MTQDEIMQPRFKVIADYPHNPYKIGELLEQFTKTAFKVTVTYPYSSVESDQVNTYPASAIEQYPHLFKALKWWEERTIDELLSVQFVRVNLYTGYWKIGDVVPVVDFEIDTKKKKVLRYVLKYNHPVELNTIEPATEEEYNRFKL